MEIHEIEKNKIEALTALSLLNMQASNAYNALTKLKEEEKVYLAEREARFMGRIEELLQESDDVLNEAYKNYEEVKSLVQTCTDFTEYITESVAEIEKTNHIFEEKTKEFDTSIQEREEQLEELRKKIKIDRTHLENDKKTLDIERIRIKEQKKRNEDERGILERAIKRLKEGRI